MAAHMQPLDRDTSWRHFATLTRRINIPLTPTSPPGLIEANTVDPWSMSGKYGLGWTYFALALLGITCFVRLWHFWQDKIRQAMYKQEIEEEYYRNAHLINGLSPRWDGGSAAAAVSTPQPASTPQPPSQDQHQHQHQSQQPHAFTESVPEQSKFRPKSHMSSVDAANDTLALFRWIFYRPIPDIVWRKRRFTFSSLAVLTCAFAAVIFVVLYCFLPQPLYWQSIRFGSPPVAIRAGMIAVALTPWIVATSMKANILSLMTGIGPERLNVLHRWAGYLCLFLSLIHTIPFYVQPVWEDGGLSVFGSLFPPGSGVIFGSGIACLVPLAWLCVASLPLIRRLAYEAFVLLHVPVGFVYVALLFWHTKNFLMSWAYLYSACAIWVAFALWRLFKLNWSKPWRDSFLIGEPAAITLMTENTIKITIPTEMRWKPGQYVYLRIPGISVLENHPFTISSMCSEDFPSAYGDKYRDCALVFRPYGGFTRKVFDTAIEKGPFHTYQAFLDGPYGGMRRDLAAFDTCVLIAGGSGITCLVSQLLTLIKRMRDGKAITRKVVVVWALKRLEAMEWFREELRICRESAPADSVTCKFFVTAAKREQSFPQRCAENRRAPRPLSNMFHDKLDGFVQGITSKRSSALIMAEAQGDAERERELRAENEDRITALPQQKYLQCHKIPPQPPQSQPSHPSPQLQASSNNNNNNLTPQLTIETISNSDTAVGSSPTQPVPVPVPELAHLRTDLRRLPSTRPVSTLGAPSGFDFGFPSTPTQFQKSLMRFAFPVPQQIDGGWSVEYGRPDLGYMLREWARGGPAGRGILGRRTAVFVCGPPSMRVGVARTVAALQAEIWGDDMLEEIFLHTENYAL